MTGKACARCGADKREFREIDFNRACGRPLANDQIKLEIFHRRIENFFNRRIETMNLVDE